MSLAILVSTLAHVLPPATAPVEPGVDALLVLSTDPGFTDEWTHSSSEHTPRLAQASRVVRGQTWGLYAFAHGYGAGGDGRVDLRYDIRVLRPDGAAYFEKRGLELWVGAVGDTSNVLLAKEGLGASFDPPDPLGTYAVTIEVHDGASQRSARASATIELVEYPAPAPFRDEDELGDWFMGYSAAPDPVRALDALVRIGQDEAARSEEKREPLRAFLRVVLDEGGFLAPLLLERFRGMEPGPRRFALDVLAGTGWDAQAFLAAASEAERAYFAERAKAVRPDPLAGPIRDPMQLDELWALHFARGAYAPIERIARALSLDEQRGGEPKRAGETVLEGAARWSLGSNLRFPRVRAYCEWMLERKVLDAPDADVLSELLDD